MRILSAAFFIFCFLAFTPSSLFSQYYGGEPGKKLDWAIHYLQEYYVDTIDNDHVIETGIRAMLKELDPYSVYLNPEEFKKQNEKNKGFRSASLGFSIYSIGNEHYINKVEENSEADKAGLKTGDQLLSINNNQLEDIGGNAVNQLLVGPENESTRIRIKKLSTYEIENLSIQFKKTTLKSINSAYMLDNQTLYIKLSTFNNKTYQEFRDVISSFKSDKFEQVILDLRGNGGGLVDAGVQLLDEFIKDEKLLVFTDGNNTEKVEFKSSKKGLLEDVKLAVLIDRQTASTSEIFTGALQDYDRAVVIGSPSFGKGLIQQTYVLNDSSAIRFSIGKYYTPIGRHLQRDYSFTENVTWDSLIQHVSTNNIEFSALNIPSKHTTATFKGRSIGQFSGGIYPDVVTANQDSHYFKIAEFTNDAVLYSFTLRYFLRNQEIMNTFIDAETLWNSLLLDSRLNQTWKNETNTELKDNVKRQVIKAWLAALIFGEQGYYHLLNKNNMEINTALKYLESENLKRLKINYNF